jgi:Zn-dependent protease
VRWSYRILTVLGTEIRLHVTFLLLVAWYAYIAYRMGGEQAAIAASIFLILVFVCVLLHEFGHILMARRFGIRTPEVLLSPIGGIARLERMPEEPRQELLVAVAGPAVTLLIAVVLGFWLSLRGELVDVWAFDPGHARLLVDVYRINIILLVFNLLPAFPMDGGRVLRALLVSRRGMVDGTRVAARIGQGFAILFGLLGLFANPMLIIIAGFIYLAAEAEAQAVEARVAGRGVTAAAMMITDFRTLRVYATIEEAVRHLLSGEQREFPIVDNDGRFEGLLTRENLIRGLSEHGPGGTVGSVMTTGIRPVRPHTPFEEALTNLRQSRLPALPVVDERGLLAGLITADNITDLILVRRHWPST